MNKFTVVGICGQSSIPGELTDSSKHIYDSITGIIIEKCESPEGKMPPRHSRVRLTLEECPPDVPPAEEKTPTDERVTA